MLACLVLLVAATSWDSISGECEFPLGHPVHSDGLYMSPGQPLVQVLDQVRVYVYSDTFGNCSGCVRALTYCYRPGSTASETLFTVEIRNNEMVQTSREVSVNHDRSNCISDLLSSPYCCIRETLAEPFSVNHNRHYALRVPSGPSSLLLRHLNQLASGSQYRSDTNQIINSPLYKPLFFFTIDSTSNNCNSAPETDVPTESTTASMSEPSTDAMSNGSVTTGTGATGSTTASDESTASTGNTDNLQDTADTADSSPGTALGAVGAVLAVVILLSVAVVVVVLCLKTKLRRRSVVVTRIGEAEGFTNEVYGALKGEKISVNLPHDDQPVYSLPSDPNKCNTYSDGHPKKHYYECIDDLSMMKTDHLMGPSPYIYASSDPLPQPPLEHSYAATGAEVTIGKDHVLHCGDDKIYEDPATSETGLYAQFEKIKITIIPSSEIEITEGLGSGQFGTVHKGVWRPSTGGPAQDVAIKTLKLSAKEADRIKFLQEGAIMGQFRHTNVVTLHGIVREEQKVLLVIELLAKTDLREHLVSIRPQSGSEVDSSVPHTLLSYCHQIATGLYYLSRKGFVHRDIAARNILLSEDHEICKIADFGMSRDLADETYYISSGGKIPVKWTAPEAIHYKKYSTASDVWSFGCLMYEIWSLGHKPFEGYINQQAIKMVDEGNRLAPPPGCPRALYHLMIKCWHPSKSERPTASGLTQTLSFSDSVLLRWAVSDKPAGAPLALKLGAALNSTTQLYPDLQRTYLPATLTDNDYEDPN